MRAAREFSRRRRKRESPPLSRSAAPPSSRLRYEREAGADAHIAFLAGLHEDGPLLAAGPLLHPVYRGLSILNLDAERARELKAKDPGVAAGKYEVIAIPWLVPSGIVRFARGRLPRSMREVDDG